MRICSTTLVFHALLNSEFSTVEPILKTGLRPLSDFPESERWQELEKHMPGFYRKLYEQVDPAFETVQKLFEFSLICCHAQVAMPVAIAVFESAHVDFVEDGVFVPEQIFHSGSHINPSLASRLAASSSSQA